MANINPLHETQFNLMKNVLDKIVNRYVRSYNRTHEMLRASFIAPMYKQHPSFSPGQLATMKVDSDDLYSQLEQNTVQFEQQYSLMSEAIMFLRYTLGDADSDPQRANAIKQVNACRTEVDNLIANLDQIARQIVVSERKIIPNTLMDRPYQEPPFYEDWFPVVKMNEEEHMRSNWYHMAHYQLATQMLAEVQQGIAVVEKIEELYKRIRAFIQKWEHVLEFHQPPENIQSMVPTLSNYGVQFERFLGALRQFEQQGLQPTTTAAKYRKAIYETRRISDGAKEKVIPSLWYVINTFEDWGNKLLSDGQLVGDLALMFADFDVEFPEEDRRREIAANYAPAGCKPLYDNHPDWYRSK